MSHRTEPPRTPRSRSVRGSVLSVLLLLALVACGTSEPAGPAIAPDLTITSPDEGAIVDDPSLTVEGRATHPDGVFEIRATIGTRESACEQAGDSFACDVSPLAEGDNTIVVTATGGDGGQATRTVRVVFEPSGSDPDAPEVVLHAPSDGTVVNADEVRIQGTASHASGIEGVVALHGTETECDVLDASFACDVALTTDGERSVTVRATATDGSVGDRTIHVDRQRHLGDASRFTFQLVFFDHPFTHEHLDAFDEAVELWESVVIGDLENVTANFSAHTACGQGEPGFVGGIDDLLIFVSGFDDPASSVLGVAGPCRSRSSASDDFGTNAVGYMEFNASFLDDLAAEGHLIETIVHEIGHVLGFGTNWEPLFSPHDLLDYEIDPSDPAEDCRTASSFTVPPRFTGAAAIAAYEARGFTGPVPVEDRGGAGTQCGHWDEETFGAELMTGFLDRGVTNPLSDISIASLEDIGLTVDVSQADEYDVPSTLDALDHDRDHGFDIAAHEILLHPIGTVDPGTGTLLDFEEPGADRERPSRSHDHDHLHPDHD